MWKEGHSEGNMKIIPAVIPIIEDEDFTSWVYSLADINHLSPYQFLTHYLNQDIKELTVKRKRSRYLKGLCQICQEYEGQGFPSVKDVLSRHYDVFVSGLFSKAYYSSILIDTVMNGTDPHPFPLICSRGKYKYCPLCMQEDMKTHHRIIAHTPHQVPGVTVCWKHHVELTTDQSEISKVIPSSDQDARIADMVHVLYQKGAIGSIADLSSLVETSYTYGSVNVAALKKAAGLDDDLLLDAYKQGKDRWKELCSSRLYDYDPDIRILSWDYPFVTIRCGKCGSTAVMYIGSVISGSVCPFCTTFGWTERIMRRVPESPDEYRVTGMVDPLHLKLQKKNENESDDAVFLYYYLNHGKVKIFKKNIVGPEKRKKKLTTNRLGETRVMHCGISATVIAYRTSHDLDIQFENGPIRKHITYASFKSGHVLPPK